MCNCIIRPNINGQPGYQWNSEGSHVRPVDPPPLGPGDELIYDEPGRCGGIDGHSHHFRLVKSEHGGRYALLVQHGCGDERIDLGCTGELAIKLGVFDDLDTHARYWLLYAIYSAQNRAADKAREKERGLWQRAAAEKRIKTRKQRGGGSVKVWIEPAVMSAEKAEAKARKAGAA